MKTTPVHIYIYRERETERDRDRETERQTDRQTDRQSITKSKHVSCMCVYIYKT